MKLAAAQAPGSTLTLHPGVKRTVLPGGLRIISEQVHGVRSATIGVFVGVGSRSESAELNGASHFLEHLLFKGTPTRSAMEISAALDAVGGEFNAYTSREHTCYHARVLDADVPLAIDILGDMLTSSLITDADVEAERGVILDEIAMHDDDPSSLLHNLLAATAWPNTALSRPVAGTMGSIQHISAAQIRDFYREHYTPAVMTVAIAGNANHADLVELVQTAFSRNGFLAESELSPQPPLIAPEALPVRADTAHHRRNFEQVNLIVGRPGLTRSDERRYALGILNTAFGGGSSSRLFQEVRERRGLAYSVYAFGLSYSDAGMIGIGAGALPSKSAELLHVVREQVDRLVRDGLTAEEIERGRGQMRGSVVLALENTAARMTRLGEAELFHQRVLSIDELLARIDAVTSTQIHQLIDEVFVAEETLAVVGPVPVS